MSARMRIFGTAGFAVGVLLLGVSGVSAQGAAPPSSAQITMHVPANAEVAFNGIKTSSSGPVRVFYTPSLEPGHTYSYAIRTSWKEGDDEVTCTRQVSLAPGNQITISVSSAESYAAPSLPTYNPYRQDYWRGYPPATPRIDDPTILLDPRNMPRVGRVNGM